jgi:hypothetical protein
MGPNEFIARKRENGEKSLIRDYSTEIDSYWETIERAWNEHADKHPIIECNLAKRQVIAYPAKEYIGGLAARTRQETQRCYDRTLREGSMMLFIRDSENRILQSYVFHRTERRTKPGRKRGLRSSSPRAGA